jgi:hypothetical protein
MRVALDDKTDECDTQAALAQFPRKPTYQLRPQPALHEAFRYERSLLAGLNATEADVNQRHRFEEAVLA